ncbi:MAG: hypothetical protein ACTSWP_02280 [Candidatus Freyarchaeota archaeon]
MNRDSPSMLKTVETLRANRSKLLWFSGLRVRVGGLACWIRGG